MLRHTFCHLPRIGEKTERRLWQSGVLSWDDALQARTRLDPQHLHDSKAHYDAANPAWFADCLPAAQSWRLYADFKGSCAFLDIETTGGLGWGQITTIALYDGRSVCSFVRGHNLDDFPAAIADRRVLVTYNGKCFDVPFLERAFGMRLGQAHIDLRHVLRSLGLRGGLKSCERQLGLSRPGMEDVDGYVAVLLWHDYRRGNDKALESLLAYNIQDAVNLETLMVLAFNRKLEALREQPFAPGYRLDMPAVPTNPFRVDPDAVGRLLRQYPPMRAW